MADTNSSSFCILINGKGSLNSLLTTALSIELLLYDDYHEKHLYIT